jgi:diguanylate cyclase (GGDEF)-like protein/PAS domain S-box-containing protein
MTETRPQKERPEIFDRPAQIFAITIIAIFFSEAIIMLILEILPSLTAFEEAIVDSLMLTLMMIPILFFLIYKPFQLYIREHRKANEALQKSEQRFVDIADNAEEWIWEVNAEGKYTYASPVVEKILGYKQEEMLGMHFFELFHPEDRVELKTAAFEAFRIKQPIREFINRNVDKNGNTVWLSTSGVPLLDRDGHLLGYRGADIDITKRKLAEEELRASEERSKAMSDSSLDAIIVMDARGVISYFNRAAEKMFGYSKDEANGRKLHEFLVSEKSREEYYRRLPVFEKTGKCVVIGKTLEFYCYRKDGTRFPAELSVSSFQIKGEWHAVGSLHDITARKDMETELKEMAITDELTGLLNRRGFRALAEQQCKIANRHKDGVTLMYADLDNLKSINDQFGHKEGDQALIEIGRILVNTFRESDIIGRLGGDEFAVLLTGTSVPDIENVSISHVQDKLRFYNKQSNLGYELSLSMGVAYCEPDVSCTLDQLLSEADKIMYEKKSQKKNLG